MRIWKDSKEIGSRLWSTNIVFYLKPYLIMVGTNAQIIEQWKFLKYIFNILS